MADIVLNDLGLGVVRLVDNENGTYTLYAPEDLVLSSLPTWLQGLVISERIPPEPVVVDTTWGRISGSLSSQTDLSNTLAEIASTPGQIIVQAEEPESPAVGDLWYDIDDPDSFSTGGTTDHTLLTNIGTNTHPAIDTHLASISNPHTVTKAQVGLGSADNTTDAAKPVSTATQTALNAKAATAHAHAAADVTSGTLATARLGSGAASGTTILYGDQTWKTAPTGGGGTTDHTALTNIGTNTHPTIDTHLASTTNPHTVTKAQVGLGSADNTTDVGKPVSTAQAAADALKVAKAGDTMTGLLTVGSGDSQNFYSGDRVAQLGRVVKGTAAAPDTSANPLVKVERISTIPASAFAPGDGGEQMASILGIHVGTSGSEAQTVGVYGAAKNAGITSTGTGPFPDACGLYGVGRITGSGVGGAIGAFLLARKDSTDILARATALELNVYNGGLADSVYTPTGSNSRGGQAVWMNAGGLVDSAAGIVFGNSAGRQWDVGIAFTAQVVGGKTGPTKSASIRDDGNAATSYVINGTHDYGIDLNGGTFNIAAIRAKGHVHFATDNTFDIGAAGSVSRPRDVYVGRDVRVGSSSSLVLRLNGTGGVITMLRNTSAPAVTGDAYVHQYYRDGTATGTLRLAARAGPSGDEVTLIDDIPKTAGAIPSSPLSFNPSTMTYEYDEFVSGGTSGGTIGKLGWNVGGGTFALVAGESGRPGIARLATTAVSGNNAYMRLVGASQGEVHTSDTFDMTWIVRLTQADSAMSVRVGMSDMFNNPATYGIYFERLAADINWFAVTRVSSTEARTDTTVVATAAAWIRLRIRRVNGTTIGFTVNDGTEILHTTNIPLIGINPALQIVTGEAVAKSIDVDWFSCRITGLAR